MSEKEKSDKNESGEGEEDQDLTIDKDIVVTKYNMAADIVNAVLKEMLGKCVAGAIVGDLCDFGDKLLTEKTAKVFKKEREVKKGIAFPTCISVNNCICHYSPLKSESPIELKDGDLVKVDLGAHIDGFIATAAHTLVVGASKENKVKGRKADVIVGAQTVMEAAIRMFRPAQHKNMEITDTIQKVSEAFDCKPIENMLSHQLKRNKIDGEKQVIQNPGEKQRQDMEKCEIDQYEVYAVDILLSTGEGKAREMDSRTTIYKKADDLVYHLKMKTSRNFFSDADKRFGTMPFTLRSFDDEVKAKAGVFECEKHGLMKPYQVLYEREGNLVAQFKSTILVMPNGILKITGLPLDTDLYETDHRVKDEKLLQLLQSSLKPNKKKGKKKEGEAQQNPPPPEEPKKPAAAV